MSLEFKKEEKGVNLELKRKLLKKIIKKIGHRRFQVVSGILNSKTRRW